LILNFSLLVEYFFSKNREEFEENQIYCFWFLINVFMEDYEIIKKLGRGKQGDVLLGI
jgi:hypothetical protein